MKKSQLRAGLLKSLNLFMGCAALITVSTSSAMAVTPGCSPAVWTAMKGKAESQLTYDTAVLEEIIKQPDSVMAMTCFDQSLHVSAENGGQIFSGTFQQHMARVVGEATSQFVKNNFTASEGNETTAPLTAFTNFGNIITTMGGHTGDTLGTLTGFGPAPGATTAPYSCLAMQALWDKVMTDGINNDVPYMSFEELHTQAGITTLPANSNMFVTNIHADRSIITTAETNITALPIPTLLAFPVNQSLEQVLTTAGIIP